MIDIPLFAKQAKEITGFELQQSRLELCCDDVWASIHCSGKGDGFFSPAFRTAFVRQSSQYVLPIALHELVGHGLFCEWSAAGQAIVDADKRHREGKDSEPFQGTTLPLLRPTYEGFAVWLENKLSKENNVLDLFEENHGKRSPEYHSFFGHFQKMEKDFGVWGVLNEAQFPKMNIRENVKRALQLFYGPTFHSHRLVLLFGSRKQNSDIDVLVISDQETTKYSNSWLDLYQYSLKDAAYLMGVFDPAITDPVMTGEVISGEEELHQTLRHILTTQAITPQAVHHNYERSREMSTTAKKIADEDIAKKTLRYATACRIAAEELQEGRRVLALKDMQQHRPYEFQ